MWQYFRAKAAVKKFKNRKQLKRFLIKEWRQVPIEFCQKMMSKYPLRLKLIVELQGRRIFKGDEKLLE